MFEQLSRCLTCNVSSFQSLAAVFNCPIRSRLSIQSFGQ